MNLYYKGFEIHKKVLLEGRGSIEYCSGGQVDRAPYICEYLTMIIPLQHAGYEIVWGEVNCNQEEKKLAAGDICLIEPCLPYNLAWCNAHYLKIELNTDYINEVNNHYDADTSITFETKIGFHDCFCFYLSQVCRERLLQVEEGSDEYCRSWLHILSCYLFEKYARSDNRASLVQDHSRVIDLVPNKNIRSVLIYLEINLGRTVSVKEMSKIAGMSQYHFTRVFKQLVGLPPSKYFALQKITKARELLLSSLSITEVAYHLGYSSQSHFSKAFSDIVGSSPKQFIIENA